MTSELRRRGFCVNHKRTERLMAENGIVAKDGRRKKLGTMIPDVPAPPLFGLLRQYFPKGTDLSRWERDDLDAVALVLNSRPRKTLGWHTPAEALEALLQSNGGAGVATTG